MVIRVGRHAPEGFKRRLDGFDDSAHRWRGASDVFRSMKAGTTDDRSRSCEALQFVMCDTRLIMAIDCKLLELQSLRYQHGSTDALARANISLAGA